MDPINSCECQGNDLLAGKKFTWNNKPKSLNVCHSVRDFLRKESTLWEILHKESWMGSMLHNSS